MRRFWTLLAHSTVWDETVQKRRIGEKTSLTHSHRSLHSAPFRGAPLRSVPRRFAPLHSALRAPLHSAPLHLRRSLASEKVALY